MKGRKLFNTDAIASELGIRISNYDCPGVEKVFEAVVVFPDSTVDEVLRFYSELSKPKFKKAMNWLEQKRVVHKGKLNVRIYNFLLKIQNKGKLRR